MWRKPVIRALVTDAVAVSVSYCQVPAATAGIWTPLFSLIMGVSALLPRGGEKLVTAESISILGPVLGRAGAAIAVHTVKRHVTDRQCVLVTLGSKNA